MNYFKTIIITCLLTYNLFQLGPIFEGLILDKTAQFVELKRQEAEKIRIKEVSIR